MAYPTFLPEPKPVNKQSSRFPGLSDVLKTIKKTASEANLTGRSKTQNVHYRKRSKSMLQEEFRTPSEKMYTTQSTASVSRSTRSSFMGFFFTTRDTHRRRPQSYFGIDEEEYEDLLDSIALARDAAQQSYDEGMALKDRSILAEQAVNVHENRWQASELALSNMAAEVKTRFPHYIETFKSMARLLPDRAPIIVVEPVGEPIPPYIIGEGAHIDFIEPPSPMFYYGEYPPPCPHLLAVPSHLSAPRLADLVDEEEDEFRDFFFDAFDCQSLKCKHV